MKKMKKNDVLKIISGTFYDTLFVALSIRSIFLDELLSAIGMLGVLMLKKLTFNNISKGTEDNESGQSDKENDNIGNETRTAGSSGAVKFTSIKPFEQGKEISGQGQKLGKRLVKAPEHKKRNKDK